ncbi:hypothetical protein SLEP1_g7920 [Rubroshorea leprosula]|uniref:Uncharacterized protein n=1 Tax=Rubroshorea leprosula TaxID=152421 RepID=A0AAV5I666_9ROSI|nr:hypothetical protein SLEP1_g7920 [Rubroshorea leprosula]
MFGYKKGRTSERGTEKSKRQPAESLEVSLRQSLRKFCVSDGRRKGSHWDTSIQNKGTSATVKGYISEFHKLGFCSSKLLFSFV